MRNDHVADHSVGDAQHAIELCDVGGICVEIDEGVVTVGQAVDLVSEFTLTPVVNVVDLALALGDGSLDTLHNAKRVSSLMVGATKTAIHKPSLCHLLWT